jgi:hypothetical protein
LERERIFWSGLGYGHTLNSYFFVFVCHYYISRIIYIHTNASSFFWSRSFVVLISLCVSNERASISLLRRRRSRSKKKEARLFHSHRHRAFPTLREKSLIRPFFLSRFLDYSLNHLYERRRSIRWWWEYSVVRGTFLSRGFVVWVCVNFCVY